MTTIETEKEAKPGGLRERIEDELLSHAKTHEHQDLIVQLAETLSSSGQRYAENIDSLFTDETIRDVRQALLPEDSPLTDIDIARAIALSGIENQRDIEINPRQFAGDGSYDMTPEEQGLFELKEFLIDLRGSFHGPVETWVVHAKEYLQAHKDALETHPESYRPIVRAFLEKYVDPFLAVAEKEALHDVVVTEENHQDVVDSVLRFTHELSDIVTKDMTLEREPIDVQSLSVADLVRDHPDRLRMEGTDLMIYSKDRDEWYRFPVPQSEDLLHKGGFPRIMVKIAAGAPDIIIESELPVNDIDVIVIGHSEAAMAEVRALNVEREGVEEVPTLDMQELLGARDATANSCLQGGKETFFSREALESAATGKVRLLRADRGLYGCDHFYVDGEVMFGPRALSRAMNQLVQVKSLHMDFNGLNAKVDLGIYWLVLARKFGSKENAPELLDRMYDIGKQMGQVREGEQDIFDVLDRVHSEHPYYDINDASFSEEQVAGWLFGKFCKQVDKHFRNTNEMRAPRSVDATEGDLKPYEVRVNLEAEASMPRLQLDVRNSVYPHRWQRLVERFASRTESYRASQKF